MLCKHSQTKCYSDTSGKHIGGTICIPTPDTRVVLIFVNVFLFSISYWLILPSFDLHTQEALAFGKPPKAGFNIFIIFL